MSNEWIGGKLSLYFNMTNELQYTSYNLVANKCKSTVLNVNSSGWFVLVKMTSEKNMTTYLTSRAYSKVDYFSENIFRVFEPFLLRNIIAGPLMTLNRLFRLMKLLRIIIKSKNNLIFN